MAKEGSGRREMVVDVADQSEGLRSRRNKEGLGIDVSEALNPQEG